MSEREWSRRRMLEAVGAAVPVVALGACARRETASASKPVTSPERDVVTVVRAMPTSDGAGVKLRRSLGTAALPLLDPFLMLDEFRSDRPDDYIKGFPDHPHRGFETVTYMLDGAMEHRDSLGNHGRLGPGSTQWMTAGRGIIHSEMPKQERGLMAGFQLWVNLPAAHKMTKPRYQDLAKERIPEVSVEGARVRLVAGEAGGARGPVDGIVTAPCFLDVTLPKGGRVAHALPEGHNAFVYVFEGSATVGPSKRRVETGELAVLGPGQGALLRSESGGRLLLLSGQPIGEPVARYGPFVMSTEAELRQAFEDYRTGRLVGG